MTQPTQHTHSFVMVYKPKMERTILPLIANSVCACPTIDLPLLPNQALLPWGKMDKTLKRTKL